MCIVQENRAFVAVVVTLVVSCIVNSDSILHVHYTQNSNGKEMFKINITKFTLSGLCW